MRPLKRVRCVACDRMKRIDQYTKRADGTRDETCGPCRRDARQCAGPTPSDIERVELAAKARADAAFRRLKATTDEVRPVWREES